MYEEKQFRAKIAISWYFFVEGAAMGNWAASIPIVKDDHDISEGILGNVLFSAAGGAMIAVPLVTILSCYYGSKWTTIFGGLLMVMVFPIIGITDDFFVLVIGAFLLGFALLILDSSMNSQAVLLELSLNKPIIGYFHAVYAIGALLGAIIGGLLFELGFSLLLEFFLFSAVLIIPDILFGFWLYTFHEEEDINRNAQMTKRSFLQDLATSWQRIQELHNAIENLPSTRSTPEATTPTTPHRHNQHQHYPTTSPSTTQRKYLDQPLLLEEKSELAEEPKDYYSLIIICSLLFIGYFGEGSIGDWSALYLTLHWECSPLVATLGYVGFQSCVAVGRFFCDSIVVYLGRQRLLILSGIVSGIGLLIAVIASFLEVNTWSLIMAILGFALCGTGLSALSPTVVSLTGSGIDGFASTTAMAIATAVGYLGVLIGPPILGNMAEICGSLAWSFLIDSALIGSLSIMVLLLPQKYHQMRSLSQQLAESARSNEPGVVTTSPLQSSFSLK